MQEASLPYLEKSVQNQAKRKKQEHTAQVTDRLEDVTVGLSSEPHSHQEVLHYKVTGLSPAGQ